jgi:peptidoglycan/xylan/chitin deacetylase (PgdA/CDA1 family)
MRKLLAPIGFLTGATARRWRSAAYRGCGLALVYHRIAGRGGRGEPVGFGVERGLPVDAFEAQMRFLLAHFRPVPTLDLLAEDPEPSRVRFSVTFDDGYRDNLTLAAPVLSRLGIPATLFLTTDFVGSDRLFWWEQLGGLLRASGERALEIGAVEPALASRWPLPARVELASPRARERAHWLISMALMRTPPGEIDAILGRLALALRAPRREAGRTAPLLDWDDVRRWQAAGFALGAHGASHANLGLAPASEAEAEVRASLAAIARETGAPALLFAYPYGGPEHRTPAVERALVSSGCRGAFTTDLGLVGPRSHRLHLARVGLGSASRLKCTYHVEQAFASEHTRAALAPAVARAAALV